MLLPAIFWLDFKEEYLATLKSTIFYLKSKDSDVYYKISHSFSLSHYFYEHKKLLKFEISMVFSNVTLPAERVQVIGRMKSDEQIF